MQQVEQKLPEGANSGVVKTVGPFPDLGIQRKYLSFLCCGAQKRDA
jgi:hypothetical protein